MTSASHGNWRSTLSDLSNNAAIPTFLASDGVTVLRRVGGTGADGVLFDGYEEFHPGDPGYEEALSIARQQADDDDEPPEQPVNADALARLLRETGLSEKDFERG
ncbi:hypothetical protein AB0L82_42480 [Nocardia sp. NPDC052001]|uniref:hypothetical protein n=1 Tax=Nocardia sp. NPDC052001 TaxID=3154853 RepID=UPI00341566F1